MAFMGLVEQGIAQEKDSVEPGEVFLTGSMKLAGMSTENNTESIFGINLGIGYRVDDDVIVGVQVSYADYQTIMVYGDEFVLDNGDVEQFAIGLFSRQNIEITDRLSFVAREGFMIINVEDDDDSQSSFAINLIPMINYQITNTLGVDLNFGGFNYQKISDADFSLYSLDLNLQNINVGVNLNL